MYKGLHHSETRYVGLHPRKGGGEGAKKIGRITVFLFLPPWGEYSPEKKPVQGLNKFRNPNFFQRTFHGPPLAAHWLLFHVVYV